MTPRLALFGSGSPASVLALAVLAERATVAAVVLPDGRPGLRALRRRRARRRAGQPLADQAERLGVATIWYRPDQPERAADQLRARGVELGCVATFPYVLAEPVWRAPGEGTIGTHPSLLPRHRGPDPLFWTYHADDREAGVSTFRLDGGADTGEVIDQESLALERGRLGSDLYLELARRGASLLAQAVARWPIASTPQDAARATREPAPRSDRWRIDFETWGAERVWHFLRGVGERGDLLREPCGRVIAHGPARGFRLEPPRAQPGTIEALADGGLAVHCGDGLVEVAGSR